MNPTCLTFNRDGNLVYTGGGDGVIKGWDTVTGAEKSRMSGCSKAVTAIACSLDNEYVLASTLDMNKIYSFRTQTNSKLMTYAGHTDTVTNVAFTFGCD